MAQLRVLFRSRLASSYSGIDRGTTTLDVTITELRTNQIYVVGEVQQPGAYQLASVATVTNALYAAAGPTALGNLRDIRVTRRDGDNVSLDLYPYLLEGDLAGDIILEQGDVVFIPLKSRRVQIHGSVVRPAQYEVTESEDLLDALSASGGFAPEANRRRITIHRVVRPGERGAGLGDRVAIDLELAPSADRADVGHLGGVIIPPVGLQDGDSIVVAGVVDLQDGYYVTVRGMVEQPNSFPWREGLTLRDLVDLARGPTTGADLREAEVSRLPDNYAAGELAELFRVRLDSSYLRQTGTAERYVGPPGIAFDAPGTAAEFELSPYDQVTIRRQPNFQMQTSVSITGEVSVPGEYTLLTQGDRITDLIARSGGVLPTGYTEGAILSRALGSLGRIDINLPVAIVEPSDFENLTLRPGDSLHIPTYSPTVGVRGAVVSPVTVLFREGQDYDYYIAAAGGYASNADKNRSSVRYANGLAETRSKFLFWSSYPVPGPGSVISVPATDPDDRLDKRGLITDLVSIVGSLATVILVIVNTTGTP
jgi:protein involved in polysaccharide export with SLBB domain